MKFIAALVVWLTVKATFAADCPNPVTCPCGSQGQNITVCVPAAGRAEICTQLSKCEACGVHSCFRCPEGLKGPFCTQEIRGRLSRQKRQSGNNVHSHGHHHHHHHHHPTRSNTVGYCPDPGVDTNGNRQPRVRPSQRGFPPGSRLVYSCNQGYDLSGERNLFCLASGEWSDSSPRCLQARPDTVGYCPDPGVDTNGNRQPRVPPNQQGFPPGSRLVYSCNQGYDLSGERNLFCLTSAEWSASSPRCLQARPDTVGYCPDPGVDTNGNRQPTVPPNQQGFPPGSRLVYSCNQGYDLSGERNLFCLTSGEWSSSSPRCLQATPDTVRYCPDPGVDTNGNRQPSQREFPPGSRLVYSCNQGYDLSGERNLFCLTSGEWSTSRPKCLQAISPPSKALATPIDPRPTSAFLQSPDSIRLGYCKYPGDIANGRSVHVAALVLRRRQPSNHVEEKHDEYPEGSRMRYSCQEGYTLEGPTILTCENSGRWSPAMTPICLSEIRGRLSRQKRLSDNNVPSYGHRNHHPVNVLSCNNPGPVLNGRVSYFAPGVRRSDSPGSSLDYELEEYPAGTEVQYFCDEGYRLQGSASLTCQSTGVWTAEAPMCAGDCGRSLLQTRLKPRDGQRTMSGEWPWVVSISIQDGDSSRFICGGAVLSTRTVVTAAHCLEAGRTYILRFAKHHYRVEDDDSEVLIRMSDRIIIHPNYSYKTMDSDIGLIMFKSRIRFSVRVQPICLPTPETTSRNVRDRKMGYVGGWGETEEGLPSDELLLSILPVHGDRECAQSYRRHGNLSVSITRNMFCAGYHNGSFSVCGGDSGSPFVFYDRVIERFTLEGLVSFAVRRQTDAQLCGMKGRYAIFTKVLRFVPWIHSNMQ